MNLPEQTRRLVITALAATILLAIATAGALGWRALDAMAADETDVATAAVALVGLFTSIAGGAVGGLVGVLTLSRQEAP